MSDFAKKHITYNNVVVNTVRSIELCPRCSGIGILTNRSEECVDYHRNDYETRIDRSVCKYCKGDGRLVVTKETIHLRDAEQVTRIPFVDFSGEPYYHKTEHVKIRVDNNDWLMNRKYPNLEKISYDHYDKLLAEYQLIESMAKKQEE